MTTSLTNKKRPLIYAIIMTIGFIFLQNLLQTLPEQYFLTGILLLYPLLIFELLITRYSAKLLLKQYSLPPVSENKESLSHLVHHVVLPSLIYFSSVSFLFFHRQPSLQPFLTIGLFFTYWILFTNIRAFYEDKFKLEIYTHNIYDIITTFSAFFTFVSIFNLFKTYQFTLLIIFIPLTAVFFLLYLLILVRYQIQIVIPVKLLIVILFAAVSLIVSYLGLNELEAGFILTETFYFIYAITIHYHEGSANLKIISEYIIIFMRSIVLLIGIT